MDDQVLDGRRRKGERRRAMLVEATMRVIEAGGVAAVSQRRVAQEADMPASAVTYHFPTVDELLVATLTACNDDYLRRLGDCASAADPLAALATLISESTAARRSHVAAEYELFLAAARRPDMRAELSRWTEAIDALLAPHVPEPVHRAGVAASVDGLFLRCFCGAPPPSADQVRSVLRSLVGPDRAAEHR